MDRSFELLILNYELAPLGAGASHATYLTAIELQRRGHQFDVRISPGKCGLAYELIEGVPNGIDLVSFYPDPQIQSADQGLRAICVSRITWRKGMDALSRAIAELDDIAVSLQIVGTGEVEQDTRALAESLVPGSRVTLAVHVAQ